MIASKKIDQAAIDLIGASADTDVDFHQMVGLSGSRHFDSLVYALTRLVPFIKQIQPVFGTLLTGLALFIEQGPVVPGTKYSPG